MTDLITGTLIPLIQGLIAVMVPVLLGLVANYVHKKTGFEVKQGTLDFYERLAIQMVLKAQGRAARYLSEKGEKLTGKLKHADAVNKFLARAPDLTVEEAKHYVDLAVVRVKGLAKKKMEDK